MPKIQNPSLNLSGKTLSEFKIEWDENLHLTNVDISKNTISVIPEELKKLVKVENLNLSSNRLEEIPSLGELQALKVLNLAGNRIKKWDDTDAEKLEKLEKIDLENNKLTELPSVVLKFAKTLSSLNLGRNSFESLSSNIGELTNLQYLFFDNNQLTTFPESLLNLVNLVEMNFSNNEIESLPDIFNNFQNVTSVNFSNNKLKELPLSFGKLISLKKLDVHGNQIESLSGELFLDEQFGVGEIYLQRNKIKQLPIELWAIDTITVLDVSSNQLESIPAEVATLAYLQRLLLAANQLESLPSEIGNLEYLEELNVSFNKLKSVPESIGNLYSLQKLYLGYNEISSLPELVECVALTELFVSGNRELKALPESIWNTPSVSIIYASDLQLTEIPSSISNLTDLTVLDVQFNQIEEVPEAIGELQIFKRLNVSHNKIKKLPSLLACYDLQSIDASFNDIQEVPEEISSYIERSVDFLFDGNPAVEKLDAEIKKKIVHIHPSSRFNIGIGDVIGRRPTMEDAMALYGDYLGQSTDFFGLYDGHAGRDAASYCGEHVQTLFKELLEGNEDKLKALAESYPKVHDKFREYMNSPQWAGESKHCGSTAVSLFLDDNNIYLVNSGDSRAVLNRNGTAVRLSHDHKPYDDDEQDRIRSLGGCVTGETGRVNGLLAVSRAVGDFYMTPFVTCEPFKQQYERTPEDEYIIIACDGVWDEVSDEESILVTKNETNPFKASCRLRDYAYLLGSDDNISVIIVQLKK